MRSLSLQPQPCRTRRREQILLLCRAQKSSRQGFGTEQPGLGWAGCSCFPHGRDRVKQNPLQAALEPRGGEDKEESRSGLQARVLPAGSQGRKGREAGQHSPSSAGHFHPWAPASPAGPSHSPAQNETGWKKPLRSSSASCDPAATPQLNAGTGCQVQALKPSRDGDPAPPWAIPVPITASDKSLFLRPSWPGSDWAPRGKPRVVAGCQRYLRSQISCAGDKQR